MSKHAGRLTVGSLVGKRPPTAYNSTPLRVGSRPGPSQPGATAPKPAPAPCCGSGCAGCPYFAGFSG